MSEHIRLMGCPHMQKKGRGSLRGVHVQGFEATGARAKVIEYCSNVSPSIHQTVPHLRCSVERERSTVPPSRTVLR